MAHYNFSIGELVLLTAHNLRLRIVGLGTVKDMSVPLYFVRFEDTECLWSLHEHEIAKLYD